MEVFITIQTEQTGEIKLTRKEAEDLFIELKSLFDQKNSSQLDWFPFPPNKPLGPIYGG